MDKLIIKEAYFMCNIGISRNERKIKQEIIIDVELFLETKKAAKKDNIKYTVDYFEVHSLLKDLVEKKEYKLIETLAETIAGAVLDRFPIKKVIVKVKKPKSLSKFNVKYTALEISREKNG